MALVDYKGSDVDIGFKQLQRLHITGRIRVGLPTNIAIMVISSRSNLLKNKSVRTTQMVIILLRWMVFVAFFWLMYLGYASSWWFVVIGVVGLFPALQAINFRTSGMLVARAINDEELYEALRKYDAWRYVMDESDALSYMRI